MSIQELSNKFKGFASNTEVLLTLLIVAVACISFYLGMQSVKENARIEPYTGQSAQLITPISEMQTASGTEATAAATAVPQENGTYVASKSGAKYHLPWCSGAKRIKEENKIWFDSKEDAERAGYTPAANCKGI